MSTPPVCPSCGSTNPVGANFCQNCGVQLTTAPAGILLPPLPEPSTGSTVSHTPTTPYPYADWPSELTVQQVPDQRRGQVDSTKTGLLLLIAGTLISVFPFTWLVGEGIGLIGGTLIFLGRKPFDKQHSGYAWWSIGLYSTGLVIMAGSRIALAIMTINAGTALTGLAGLGDAFSANYNYLILTMFLGGAVIGVAQVLFTYALQKPTGRVILWAAYVGALGLGVYILSVIGSQVTPAVQAAFSGSTFNSTPIDDLQTQASNLKILGIIPSTIYAAAYYLARSRINADEFLTRETPTSQTSPVS